MDAVFTNPITGKIETMPIAMIGAYVPHASHLNLAEAARVAAIRDDEAATNLLNSIMDTEYPCASAQGENEPSAEAVKLLR